MNKKIKRILAALLTVCIAVSCVIFLPDLANAAQSVTYSKTENSGIRGQICTTLSGTGAEDYYTGGYEYDELSGASSSYIKSSLSTLMRDTHTTVASYDDCHNKADKTDSEGGNGKVTLIYTSYQATMSQWNGWNREHVWPQSLGGNNTTGGGADLHHIRPSDAGVNSSRGNKKYGYAGSGASEKYGTNPAVGVLGGSYNSTYFEPLDNVKGDVARIILYVHVRWGADWGADSVTKVFESVDVLLEWCALDPVDTWEMGRNEVVENIQGNRNVFIDYPEYAWLIFGKDIPADMVTPSGEAMGNGEQTTVTEKQTTEQTTEQITEQTTEHTTENETDPSEVENSGIVSSNIYYADKLRFMFASSIKPSITLADEKGTVHTLAVEPYTVNGEQYTYNGYPVWISAGGVPLHNISKRITVTVGEQTQTYSVLEYLYTRLYVSENVTQSQRNMYEQLIKYANSADVVINGVGQSSIGSEYLVKVTNGTLDCVTDSDLYLANDTPFANISSNIEISEGKTLAWQVRVTENGVTETETYSDEQIRTLAITGHTVVTAIEVDEDVPEPVPVWTLVTDASQLSVGDKIIITAADYDFALSTVQNNNNRGQTEIVKNNGILVSPSDTVQIITLEQGAKEGTFALYTGDAGYLCAASSSSNYLRTKTALDANASWSISISGDGAATIVAQGSYSRNYLKYNKGSKLFACYSSTSTMQSVSIYVLVE